MAPAGSDRPSGPGAPLFVARPLVTRWLTMVLAPVLVVAFAILSWWLTNSHWRSWHTYDIVWMNAIGLLFGLGLWRMGSVRVRAFATHLEVRNFVRTIRLDWTQILGLTFHRAGSSPWATLDLSDGTVVPVMAIQISEGERGLAQAGRLRRLIDELGTADT